MQIERNLLNTLRSEKKLGIHGGIYHRMQVDFAYNSNHIEGSRLTHEQTQYIFDTKSIGEPALVNDVFETTNHFRCFDHILQTVGDPLSENYIKALHGMLKQGVFSEDPSVVISDYKRYANEVGSITTAKPSDVSEQMQQLLQQYTEIAHPDLYDIAAFHLMLMDIQDVDTIAVQEAVNEDAERLTGKSIRDSLNLVKSALKLYGVRPLLNITLPPIKPKFKEIPTALQVMSIIRGSDIELPASVFFAMKSA